MKSTPKLPSQTKPFLKPYQRVNPDTGEVESGIKYFEGQPQNIRFNGQSGRFSVDGRDDLGPSLQVTPIAWRFFSGALFGRSPAEYAELFYVDKARNLSVVLFTNASAHNLKKYIASLAYTDGRQANPTNTVVRISASLRIRKKDSARYNVAEFEPVGPASVEAVTAFRLFCADHKVYRADTRPHHTGSAEVEDHTWSATYFTRIATGIAQALPVSAEEAQQIQRAYS